MMGSRALRRACRSQIVRFQNFEDCAADIADVSACGRNGEHRHRHDHVPCDVPESAAGLRRDHAARGQQAPFGVEKVGQQQRKEKSGNAAGEKRSGNDCVVPLFIAVQRAVYARRHGDEQADDQGGARQQQRRADILADDFAHRAIAFVAGAQIAPEQLSQPPQILHPHRLIKAQLFGLERDAGGTHSRAAHHFQRTARRAHDGVVDDGDAQQYRNGQQQLFGDVFPHIPMLLPSYFPYGQAVR